MATLSWGIRIYLQDADNPVTENTAVGIYNRAGTNSEIRWTQITLSSPTWGGTSLAGCAGIIIDGGFGEFTKSIDLKRGGNIADAGSGSITIKNTGAIWQTFLSDSDQPIYLNGLRAEIYSFSGATGTIRWYGFCEEPRWDSKTYTIPLIGSAAKRSVITASEIDDKTYPSASEQTIGKCIPVTYGLHVPEYKYGIDPIKIPGVDYPVFRQKPIEIERSTFAKFVRVNDKQERYTTEAYANQGAAYGGKPGFFGNDIGRSIFHIVEAADANVPSKKWYVRLAEGLPDKLGVGGQAYSWFVGKYIHVIAGTGQGEWRKITAATLRYPLVSSGISYSAIEFEIDTAPGEMYDGHVQGYDANQTYVEIVDVAASYLCDTWPCYAYKDAAGETVTKNFSIHAYESGAGTITVSGDAETVRIKQERDGLVPITDESIEASSLVNKNGYNISPKVPTTDIESVEDFYIVSFPLYFTDLYSEDNLKKCSLNTSDGFYSATNYKKKKNGIYSSTASDNNAVYSCTMTSVDGENYIVLGNASGQFGVNVTAINHATAWCIDLPEIPNDLKFDSVHVLVYINSDVDTTGSSDLNSTSYHIRAIRDFGFAYPVIAQDVGTNIASECDLRSLPLSVSATYGDNDKFYFDNLTVDVVSSLANLNGYKNYEIVGITNAEQYRQLRKIVFLRRNNCDIGASGVVSTTDTIYGRIAFAFKKSYSLKDAIYAPHHGRIFNSTWGSRKTQTDPIDKIGDVIEAACRLQYWGDLEAAPTLGWGKEYADNALIRTSTDNGSFDSALLPTDTSIAAQFIELNESKTDEIKRKACRDFFLANYQDSYGYECLKRITLDDTSSVTVTLADIVNRHNIKITEPLVRDIFCEPFVRYNKNIATGEYGSRIAFTNSSAASYSTDYVSGIIGGSAQEYWTRCNSLWKRCRCINTPPSDLTDLTFANSKYADEIAENYIKNWIDWQLNKEIVFDTTWEKAGAWELCQRFSLNLPHQTAATSYECIVVGLDVSPIKHVVSVRALMFGATVPISYSIQDIMTQFGNNYDWQDHMQTLAERGEGGNDIQDVT